MIEVDENNRIYIPNWEKHQNIDGLEKIREQGRLRQVKHRNKQTKLIRCNVTPDVIVTDCNAIEVEEEKEREKDIPDSNESGIFYTTKKKRKLSGKRLEKFNDFWEVFNFKKDKANAADSWLDIPTLTDALVKEILSAAKIEAENRQALVDNGSTPKWAQGWLSSRRWEDEVQTNHKSSIPESDIIEYEYDDQGRPIY